MVKMRYTRADQTLITNMPLTFLNGGEPNYTGQTFTTANELINHIETTLVSAGWVSISKVVGTSVLLRGTSQTNNHNCWVEFVYADTSYLYIRGWLEQAKTNGSPQSTTSCRVVIGTENRLWITANSDAGCICIIPNSAPAQGVHFGFLDRLDTTDQWAWMVGYISGSNNVAYSAKSKFDSTNWRAITTDMSNRQWGTYDAMWADSPGRRNYDGACLVRPYYWLEGRSSADSVNNFPNSPHFRGNVQYAYTGMASTSAGTFGTDPTSGFRFMSVGDSGWQAMRIA